MQDDVKTLVKPTQNSRPNPYEANHDRTINSYSRLLGWKSLNCCLLGEPLWSHGSLSAVCACANSWSPSRGDAVLAISACSIPFSAIFSSDDGTEGAVTDNTSSGCTRCHLVSGKPTATATNVAPIKATLSHQKFRQPEYCAMGPDMIGPT